MDTESGNATSAGMKRRRATADSDSDDQVPEGKQTAQSDSEGEAVEGKATDTGSRPNKRQKIETVTNSDKLRYMDNAEANKAALKKIYDAIYKNGKAKTSVGKDKDKDKDKDRVYSILTYGNSQYLRTPVDAKAFKTFTTSDSNYTVESQLMTVYRKYLEAKQAGKKVGKEPKKITSFEGALKNGDYFYVRNAHYDKENMPGRGRRIIVNVTTQQAALKAAADLNPLYSDQSISPYIKSYKVYLSANPKPKDEAKYDKLVVYYAYKGDEDAANDEVGDRIVAALDAAVPTGERETTFAPFYSKVTEGIAWAEESEAHLPIKQGTSFSDFRATIIADVIAKNPKVDSPEQFAQLVDKALDEKDVDPEAPHRHLTQTNV
jgi:hypothetical protein